MADVMIEVPVGPAELLTISWPADLDPGEAEAIGTIVDEVIAESCEEKES